MFLIETDLKQSNIEGLGVFARYDIKKGTVIGIWDGNIDIKIIAHNLEKLPISYQEHIKRFAYRAKEFYMLGSDNMKFMNHSDTPNILSLPFVGDDIAERDIKAGEELTCNYFNFDEEAKEKLGA